jgi:uncharacterized protein YecT (DUF1311 family)
MRRVRTFLTVFALFAFSGGARAAEKPEYSAAYLACMEKSGGVTASMLECADAEIALQDARLNKAYRALLKESSAKRQKQLRDVQRLWIAYRKANCDFYEDPDKGTSAAISASSCYLSLLAARATELENLLEN